MRYFWYQKTMIGRWGANLSDTATTAVGTDGSKKLPLGPVYDLEKLTAERIGVSHGLTSVDYTVMGLTELVKRFPPPADEGSAPVVMPEPPRPPLPPAEAPVAPPLVPEVPIPVPYGTVTVPGSLVNEAPAGKPIPVVWSGDGKPPEWERPITMSPTLAAPYGLGVEGIKEAYVQFVRLRLDATHPRKEEVRTALWKMKVVEGFAVISDIAPGAAVDRHITRAAELIPGWVEDFDAFQRVSPEIV